MLNYISFRVFEADLELRLNEYAKQGYQVTTCEPVIVPAPDGQTVSVSYILIMARVVTDPEEKVSPPNDEEPEGIPMKG
jgi:hypothetical protein